MLDWRLGLVIIFGAILRFWRLGLIPPMSTQSYLTPRFTSSIYSLGSIILLYYICKKIFRVEKIAQLSSFIFAILPWTIEQGRISSEPTNVLFWMLLILFINMTYKNRILNLVSILFIPLLFYFIHPNFWILKNGFYLITVDSLLKNIFVILTPDFLFFKNDTFWWGGIRDVGVLHLSLLPFFILGIYQLIVKEEIKAIIWFGICLFFYASNPLFPEGREFFLATPIIALIVALGIYQLFYYLYSRNWQLVLLIFLLILVYDFASFLHYYAVHYQLEVQGYLSRIHGVF